MLTSARKTGEAATRVSSPALIRMTVMVARAARIAMTGWVDFRAIKRAASLEQILRDYRIPGLRRNGKDRYRGRCPIHGGEGRECFHADLAHNVFHCFSCGAGGTVLDLVAAMEKCGLREAALKLAGRLGVPEVYPGQRPEAGGEKQLVTKKRTDASPLGFRLRGVDSRHSYLHARGIGEQTAAEFGVGFYGGPGLMSGRLVFPIHDPGGELVAYCGRSLDGAEPRYKFPAGFAKSRVIFNLHRAAATQAPAVIAVEGFFDCLKVHQAGFHSVVALMGAALYERQQELLVERFRKVVLMLDGDETGRRASAAIAARLGCRVRVIDLAAGVQPDQLSGALIQQLVAGNLTKEERKAH